MVFEKKKVIAIPQTSYHEGSLGNVEEIYYIETGAEGFFRYLSAPLAK